MATLTQEQIRTINLAYDAGYREAVRFGVIAELANAHAIATAVLAYLGLPARDRPDIISGYRDPARQRELRQRWDTGRRAGLVARPALRSWHMVGRAIDVQRVRGFDLYRQVMEELGVRWGGRFNNPDPVHFDLPDTNQPPTFDELLRA